MLLHTRIYRFVAVFAFRRSLVTPVCRRQLSTTTLPRNIDRCGDVYGIFSIFSLFFFLVSSVPRQTRFTGYTDVRYYVVTRTNRIGDPSEKVVRLCDNDDNKRVTWRYRITTTINSNLSISRDRVAASVRVNSVGNGY